MPDTLMLALLFLLLGLLTGALAAWLIAKYRFRAGHYSTEEVDRQFVRREVFEALQQQADLHRDDSLEKAEEINLLTGRLAAKEQLLLSMEDRLSGQQKEVARLQERSRLEFENIANRLLEEKSQKFTAQNQKNLHDILGPLHDKIKSFEESIEKRYLDETKDRISLKKEIEQLYTLNQQLSLDASNLANALKGDNKTQGDWGELQLEMLLQKAGLHKNVHYQAQHSFKDENGQAKRPDFVIHLPDDKQLVIDAKVSLRAYEEFFNCDDPGQKQNHLKAHVNSVRQHIKELSAKNYQHLYQINSPDYLLMFIPIEPAFAAALQEDHQLFLDALDKNIVLVTTSTLLATMRTVSFIWKQEKQKRSVLEIARQSGLLYDKFCAFVEDLKTIGQRLEQTQGAYHDAMNKLTESKKFGDTLVGRAQRIRELGAKASKKLPADLIEAAREEEE